MIDIETTFWSVMRQLEDLAVGQYKKYIPELNTLKKQTFLQNVRTHFNVQEDSSSDLSNAIHQLVKTATKSSRVDTLLLQGFTLELLGQAIYRAILNTPSLGESSHKLAEDANNASQEIFDQVLSILENDGLVGDPLFKSFVSATHDVFGELDSMGSLIDEAFSGQGQLKFDNVLADAVTELLKHGTELGIDRKKLLRQLTSSLMIG